MKSLLELLFDPRGKISSNLCTLGIALALVLFILLTGFCITIRLAPPFQGVFFNIAFTLVFFLFLYQVLILIGKRLRDIGVGNFISNTCQRLLNLMFRLAWIGVWVGVLAVAGLIWQTFQIPEQLVHGRNLCVVECRYPFGSWYNLNSLTILPNALLFEENGFLGKRILSIPYLRVKTISFTDGLVWNKVAVATASLPFSEKEIFLQRDSNLFLLRDQIKAMAGSSLIVEEQRTMLRRFFSLVRRIIKG